MSSPNPSEGPLREARSKDSPDRFLAGMRRFLFPVLTGLLGGAVVWAVSRKLEDQAVALIESKLQIIEAKNSRLEDTLGKVSEAFGQARTRVEDLERMHQDMEDKHKKMTQDFESAKSWLEEQRETLAKVLAAHDEDMKSRLERIKASEESLRAAASVVKDANKTAETVRTTAAFAKAQDRQEEIVSALVQDGGFMDKLMAGIQAGSALSNGFCGAHYRAEYDGKDGVTFHTSPNQKSEAGVVHRISPPEPQFTRLSTSVYWNGGTPRCHVRFQGWLSEAAFAGGSLPDAGAAAQLEIRRDAPADARSLKRASAGGTPVLAVFNPGVPVFATGRRQDGHVEVTFDGWIAVETDRSGRRLIGPVAP
ncbi:MAG TPA: hypothetical protein DIT64_06975 [Verrucomicrobiales bacterium]|nr:hypothetical protein [Verrucomicrobiales bacterium]